MDLSEAEEISATAKMLRDRIRFLEGALDDAIAVINEKASKKQDVNDHIVTLRALVAQQKVQIEAKDKELASARQLIDELKESLVVARRRSIEVGPVIKPSFDYGRNTVRMSGY